MASEELDIATKLMEEGSLNKDEVSHIISEIKQEIIEKNPGTKEEVEKIVSEQLEKYDIQLSEEDQQMLINLFDWMRHLNIDYDKVKNQLDDLVKDIQKDAGIDDGFFDKIWEEIKNFFSKIGQFFKGLFS